MSQLSGPHIMRLRVFRPTLGEMLVHHLLPLTCCQGSLRVWNKPKFIHLFIHLCVIFRKAGLFSLKPASTGQACINYYMARSQHRELHSKLFARSAWVLKCPLLTSTEKMQQTWTFYSFVDVLANAVHSLLLF